MRKILIMGLPGSGKTTLATSLVKHLGAVHFNADAVRANVNRDLGFLPADRIEQARRMGWLCDRVTEAGHWAVADFVCPTEDTREAFMAGGPALVVWMNTVSESRFKDTNALFQPPTNPHVTITARVEPDQVAEWAEKTALSLVALAFPTREPTDADFAWAAQFDDAHRREPHALLIGRYQPFHDGHRALVEESVRRVGRVVIAVRDTTGTDEKNPFTFEEVERFIHEKLTHLAGRYAVVGLPNITNVFYGRDVGYAIEKIELTDDLHAISATEIRRQMGI